MCGVWTEGGHRYPSGSAVLRKARDVRCERVGEPVLRERRWRIGVAEWTLGLRPEAGVGLIERVRRWVGVWP